MDQDIDTGIPLLEFGLITGWEGLASYLTMLGIETSPDALQARRRRYELPVCGGGTRGRRVSFSTAELDVWMKHLRGFTLAGWIAHQKLRRANDLPLLHGAPGRRTSQRLLPFPAFDLYALTTCWPFDPEHLLRDDDGYLYAARDPAVFADKTAACVEDMRVSRAWRYFGMRRAGPDDLRGPKATWARRKRRRAGRLIGAVVRVGDQLRWCRVPGPLLGLPQDTTTVMLLAWSRVGAKDAIDWIRGREPEAVFLAWTRREEVDPVTLEELPHPRRC